MNINLETIDPFSLPFVEIADHENLPKSKGVYFAIANGKVQYIGRATSSDGLRGRGIAHHKAIQIALKSGARIAYIEISDRNLVVAVERVLINHFNPPLNNQVKTGIYQISLPQPISQPDQDPVFIPDSESKDDPMEEEEYIPIEKEFLLEEHSSIDGFMIYRHLYRNECDPKLADAFKNVIVAPGTVEFSVNIYLPDFEWGQEILSVGPIITSMDEFKPCVWLPISFCDKRDLDFNLAPELTGSPAKQLIDYYQSLPKKYRTLYLDVLPFFLKMVECGNSWQWRNPWKDFTNYDIPLPLFGKPGVFEHPLLALTLPAKTPDRTYFNGKYIYRHP